MDTATPAHLPTDSSFSFSDIALQVLTWGLGFIAAWAAQDLTFAMAMIAAMVLREYVRKTYAKKKHGVQWNAPYLIPLPFTLGMMGTVGYLPPEKPISRKALFEVAAVGSLVLFASGMFCYLIGLPSSQATSPTEGFQMLHQNSWFENTIFMAKFKSATVQLSSLALAGQALLVLACWNLLPLGQTDGGYIAQALAGKKSHFVTIFISVLVFILAVKLHPIWFVVLVMFLLFMSRGPTVEENSPAPSFAKWLIPLAVLMLMHFSLVPFNYKLLVLP